MNNIWKILAGRLKGFPGRISILRKKPVLARSHRAKGLFGHGGLHLAAAGLCLLSVLALTIPNRLPPAIVWPAIIPGSEQTSEQTKEPAADALLENQAFYSDLPVGKIVVESAPTDWGTAVFIPQYHRLPGSKLEDEANNRAAMTQAQIYLILEKIIDKTPVKLVMMEGELTGPVPAVKIQQLTAKIKQRDEFAYQYRQLRRALQNYPLNANLEEGIFQTAEELIAAADREIVLQGAPIKLQAEGKPFRLIGLENAATREESKTLVRNYLYLEDRLTTLEAPRGPFGSAQVKAGTSFTLSDVYQLLQSLKGGRSLATDIQLLEQLAIKNGRTTLAEVIQKFQRAWQNLSQTDQDPIPAITEKAAPSRTDNPYAGITSVSRLKRLLQGQEEKIERIVINRRDQEAAENFAKALKANNENIGVIQYGAGHEAGLTQNLKKRGLSVIIVPPRIVAQIQTQSPDQQP